MLLSEQIAQITLPSPEAIEAFEKEFHELLDRTGVAASYFMAGSDPKDPDKLEIHVGGDETQSAFLQIFMDYADSQMP